MKMDLLWENAAPTSAFAGQTISVDLSEYDLVLIAFIFSCAEPMTGVTSIVPIDGKQSYINWPGWAEFNWRYFTASNSRVIFTEAQYHPVSGSGNTTDNSRTIPYRIYGMKL